MVNKKTNKTLCLGMGYGMASTGKWWWLSSWQTSGRSGKDTHTKTKAV